MRFTVEVPATTANLGPGFDCLAMALDIWNAIEVEVGASGIEIEGEGADTLPRDESNLVYGTFLHVFSEAAMPPGEARITCRNAIPLGRGLGSSSAAVVGGLVAGNEVCGRPYSRKRLLEIAARIEGHPDNAAAALMGGCQIVVQEGDGLVASPLAIPEELKAVLFVPDVPMPTERAREVLADKVDRQDAVYNIGRAALLAKALSTGDLTLLTVATGDRLHQPARQKIFPAMKNIFGAALSAGALGVFLSGAGSSVLALTRDNELTIGYEMADAADRSGVGGSVKITRPTSEGVRVRKNP